MKPLLYARRSRPQPPPSCRQERLAWQGVHGGHGSGWGPQHLQVQRLGLGQAAGAARGGGVRARPRGQLRVSVRRWGLVAGTHGVAGSGPAVGTLAAVHPHSCRRDVRSSAGGRGQPDQRAAGGSRKRVPPCSPVTADGARAGPAAAAGPWRSARALVAAGSGHGAHGRGGR